MTLSELSQAKVLILDLLGCGLSPENLVDAGISKECLVPCLREMKLRLPTNIDLSDIVLYDPPPEFNAPMAATPVPRPVQATPEPQITIPIPKTPVYKKSEELGEVLPPLSAHKANLRRKRQSNAESQVKTEGSEQHTPPSITGKRSRGDEDENEEAPSNSASSSPKRKKLSHSPATQQVAPPSPKIEAPALPSRSQKLKVAKSADAARLAAAGGDGHTPEPRKGVSL